MCINKSFKFNRVLVILFFIPIINWAQNVTGTIVDKDKNPLEFVAVAVLNPQDSILISYASTNKFGKFKLIKVPEGKALFQVHLIGFETVQKIIDFKNESIDLGEISLNDENILDEVTVNAVLPIIIKKDTVAYNTKAFKVRVDDTVEDLLKKLPGVEVDAAGKVTAQGEEVTEIYVGGKVFFSGDPAIATKNISADAIKSVEVIDQKSEQSRVSGVNDSEQNKVINLILKDDKKINDFGKAQVGYGTDDRYLTSLNYNRFSSKLQTSIIGKFNNVNTSGSDISEIMSFSGGGRSMSSSGGGSSGYVTTGVGGLNLGYELKKEQNLNADYFYNYTNSTSGDVIINRTEFIGNEEILSESRSRSENLTNSNALNFSYIDRSNKRSSLYITGSGNISRNDANSINTLDKYNGLNELDLQSIGNTYSKSNNSSGNINFDYSKRFNEKSKRHMRSSGIVYISKNNSVNTNNQLNRFNISDPLATYNEKQEFVKDQNLENISTDFDLNYIEPLSEHHLIEFRGGLKYNSNNEDVNQLNYVDDILQAPLIYKQYYRNTDVLGRIRYKYDNEKLTISVGASLVGQTQDFGLENEPLNEFENKYTNFNPELNVRYIPKRGTWFRFSMNKDVKLPSLFQLSPVVNNFNPLFISQGNPYLTPEDNYSIFGMYGKHDFATGFSLFTRLSYSYTKNSIVNSEFTDALGVRYSTYENLADKNNFSARVHLGNRIKAIGVRYVINLTARYSEYMSIINTLTNETQSKDGTIGLSFENDKKDKIDASIGASWEKNYTTFTSGNNSDRDYLQQSYYTKVDWNITDRFNINTQFTYSIYTDSNFGTDQSVPIWNGSISYALTKFKSLNLMFSALDILNKNIGIERNSSDNYFEEVHKEVLGNYFMLSLTYNLNGNKSSKGGSTNMHSMGRAMRVSR